LRDVYNRDETPSKIQSISNIVTAFQIALGSFLFRKYHEEQLLYRFVIDQSPRIYLITSSELWWIRS
jgi:hypothetical protein